jgi:hypothetical protein
MNFSVISSMILLWGIFLWASLGSLVKFIMVCCAQDFGIHFLHFPIYPLLNCFVLFCFWGV